MEYMRYTGLLTIPKNKKKVFVVMKKVGDVHNIILSVSAHVKINPEIIDVLLRPLWHKLCCDTVSDDLCGFRRAHDKRMVFLNLEKGFITGYGLDI